ncbi:hypothetical protein M430DRAFT_21842 [Amorphotheca resinae ATCC 22711]|uniref:Uncharacterized protein n=1 Tax=Amorphotheca resinae ATCC 22711 TaxID=857342 RepID=A0A2T3ASK8_AMORE|nr:hypothetical protein M430DRAFT_21842 [Amorphotheca resinae ATCC 22711]PSS10479.1 hypothetical protein M430DRAFT_21842 [Amorphotheca resinae ATCC 22711]
MQQDKQLLNGIPSQPARALTLSLRKPFCNRSISHYCAGFGKQGPPRRGGRRGKASTKKEEVYPDDEDEAAAPKKGRTATFTPTPLTATIPNVTALATIPTTTVRFRRGPDTLPGCGDDLVVDLFGVSGFQRSSERAAGQDATKSRLQADSAARRGREPSHTPE